MCKCECCESVHDGSYGSGRFCSNKCARAFSTRVKRKEINSRVSIAAKKVWDKKKIIWIEGIQSFCDIKNQDLKRKILRVMGIGCSRCGWNEGSCDFHHINGRNIPNADSQENVTYICPNCHRLFHEGKIGSQDVKSLEIVIGNSWKDVYMRL